MFVVQSEYLEYFLELGRTKVESYFGEDNYLLLETYKFVG